MAHGICMKLLLIRNLTRSRTRVAATHGLYENELGEKMKAVSENMYIERYAVGGTCSVQRCPQLCKIFFAGRRGRASKAAPAGPACSPLSSRGFGAGTHAKPPHQVAARR